MKKFIVALVLLIIGAAVFVVVAGGGRQYPIPATGCLNTYNEATEEWDSLSGDASLEPYLLRAGDAGVFLAVGFDAWAKDNGYDFNPDNCYFDTEADPQHN